MRDIIRRCRFSPYRKGCGPTFQLVMWDTYRSDSLGKSILGYSLRSNGAELFTGEDFHCSPLHAIDSDECVRSLMTFLTLKPGDTDESYFDGYSSLQVDYVNKHAEALGLEVMNRFGEG